MGSDTKIVVPEGITALATSLFWDNQNIEEVVLPESLINLGGDTFYNCFNLKKVNIPKNIEKAKKKVILYSYEELDLFVKALENLENKELQMAIYTSLNTGARRGEVMALTFEDINTKRCSIDFNKSKVNINGGTQIKDIKTGKNRQFYVSKNYIDLVNKYYKYLGKPEKNTPMFTIHPDTYSKKFKD